MPLGLDLLLKLIAQRLFIVVKVEVVVAWFGLRDYRKYGLDHRFQAQRANALDHLDLLARSSSSPVVDLRKRHGYDELNRLRLLKYVLDNERIAEVNELPACVLQPRYVNEPDVLGGMLHESGEECLRLGIRVPDLEDRQRHLLLDHRLLLLFGYHWPLGLRYFDLVLYLLDL